MEVAKEGDIHLPELNPLINKNGDVNQQISKTKPQTNKSSYSIPNRDLCGPLSHLERKANKNKPNKFIMP